MPSAVYAGSFDPPTNGHAWMIRHAAAMFDRLIVSAAVSPDKSYTYSLERRQRWLREICSGYDNVEVADIGNQFLARYAEQHGVRYIVRGIRNTADYQFERTMRHVNSDLAETVTSVFLMPPRELCEVSSSMVKGMIGPEGWHEVVRELVPACVYADLAAELGQKPSWAGAQADGPATGG